MRPSEKKMGNHINRTMRYGDEVVKVITKYSDPQKDYSTKNMLADLSDEDKKSSVKK